MHRQNTPRAGSTTPPNPEQFMTSEEVGRIIGCAPQAIRDQARDNPDALGFATCVYGTRVVIPREAFFHWLKYGNAPIYTPAEGGAA